MPWNYSQIQSLYPGIGIGHLQHTPDNRINIRPSPLASEIHRLALVSPVTDPEDPGLLAQAARNIQAHQKDENPSRVPLPTFGFVAQWLSEIAGPSALEPLLRHADQYLNPTWHKGGLYYRRRDETWDKEGEYVHMVPYSGIAGVGYARLNVVEGGKRMYDHPWTPEQVKKRPYIEGVGLENDVDWLRGTWIENRKALVATCKTWDGKSVTMRLSIKNLPR